MAILFRSFCQLFSSFNIFVSFFKKLFVSFKKSKIMDKLLLKTFIMNNVFFLNLEKHNSRPNQQVVGSTPKSSPMAKDIMIMLSHPHHQV